MLNIIVLFSVVVLQFYIKHNTKLLIIIHIADNNALYYSFMWINMLLMCDVLMFLCRVIDSCQEAFILRLYRQKNKVFYSNVIVIPKALVPD